MFITLSPIYLIYKLLNKCCRTDMLTNFTVEWLALLRCIRGEAKWLALLRCIRGRLGGWHSCLVLGRSRIKTMTPIEVIAGLVPEVRSGPPHCLSFLN
jgi:hypothetical protein